MHVRKRLRIDLDRLAEAGGAVGPAVRDADRHVGERPVRREALSPALDVHLLSQLVRRANDLFVVNGSPSFPSYRKPQISRELVEKEINGGNPAAPGNDEICPGVSRRRARPALYPLDPPAIAHFLGSCGWLISKVRVSSPDRARDAIDLVAAAVGAPAGHVEHAGFGED